MSILDNEIQRQRQTASKRKTKTYRVNEIFATLQGEGHRAGSANIFVRFSGCNLTCSADSKEENGQLDCDTEFASGRSMTADEIAAEVYEASPIMKWIVFTGGEPGLQLDEALLDVLKERGPYQFAVETNGTQTLPGPLHWICVSPKTAEHTLRVGFAHELKYVRHAGQAIPRPSLKAEHKFISPAWAPGGLQRADLEWCIKLVKENPEWRLSIQQHKVWKVR